MVIEERNSWQRLVMEPRPVAGAWIAAALVGLAWIAGYASGGSGSAASHLFYLGLLVAALQLPQPVAIGYALFAGLLAGPLLPADVDLGIAQHPGSWTLRLVMFAVITWFAAFAVGGVRTLWQSESVLAQRERELVEQRGAILRSVTHEFRTPLAVIKSSTEMLARRDLPTEQRQRVIESVERQATRLEDLVSLVLAAANRLSESDRITSHVVGTEQLLASVVSELWVHSGRERVHLHVDPHASRIVTVPDYLRVLVRCLVENALKFSPPGEPVEVSVVRSPDAFVLEIRDFGAGIPESFAGERLDPFTQGDGSSTRAVGGLGLGLYTSRRLVDRLGGRLTFDWPATGGTLARVALPQRREVDREVYAEALETTVCETGATPAVGAPIVAQRALATD